MESWWLLGGESADVTNAAALAKLAVRLAATARPEAWLQARGPGSQKRDDSRGDPGYRLCDPRLADYYRVVDEVSTKYKRNGDGTGSNDAVASCTQFVAHCVRATVDPDCFEFSTRGCREYLAGSPRWARVCELGPEEVDARCEPGDVLCFLDDSHTVLYAGHALIVRRFPAAEASANVVEARYTDAAYPECVSYGEGRGYPGHEGNRMVVYRFTDVTGGCIHPYINVWHLLQGEEDFVLDL